jgi:hypothetical protein
MSSKSELELEAAYTRKHLERVPMDRLDFEPHEKIDDARVARDISGGHSDVGGVHNYRGGCS